MSRTRIVFFVVVLAAVIIVTASFFARWLGQQEGVVTAPSKETLEVRIVCALPVEPWVREAAKQFNQEKHKLEGQPIKVSVIPMDGLTAMGRYEREEMDPLPTAWIPDSRYLVELVNAAYKEKLGRDVFLTDGEYRARPIAVSLFSWGIYSSRAEVLRDKYGEIDWQAIHDAATAKGGWPELGGEAGWGYFKLVVPNPRKNVGGLAAMVAAAGEYYQKTNINTADVTDAEFQEWLGELMGAVTDFSSLGSYSVENLALFGYSMGDGGQLLESDLLSHMAGIQTRWADPLVIVYPKYLTWFDFPFTTWMGPETSALEKNAALEFQRYLLSPEVQRLAVERGLRPANPEVPVTGQDSLFVRWQEQGAMTIVPRTTAMRSPDRDVLMALLRWFDLNVAQR
ncbi:MAG: substrate-binding domain-containing protein [Anaerolineae bacterium]|nr:substrate-binding domain-containing protein [Anaerolineae bacterium]